MSRSEDLTEGLTSLGKSVSNVPEQGPDSALLEAFPNRFPQRNYIVQFSFPEFTSLCPVTGQPDFGTIVLEYIPDNLCVESKSFKIYMFAYRSHQTFMETVTNKILEDICNLLKPRWCRVKGLFAPRGATRINVFCEYWQDLPADETKMVKDAVSAWKLEKGI